MENHESAIEKLFDENNNDNIILYNEKGEPTEFEQAALIPYEHKMYAILSLAKPNNDIGDDEGLVFAIEADENEKYSLVLVTDEEIINAVFDIYESLLDEYEDDELDLDDEPDDELDEILDELLGDEDDGEE